MSKAKETLKAKLDSRQRFEKFNDLFGWLEMKLAEL
jgi:hypothetical protein